MTTNDSISKDGEKGVKKNMTAFLAEEYASPCPLVAYQEGITLTIWLDCVVSAGGQRPWHQAGSCWTCWRHHTMESMVVLGQLTASERPQ